MDQNAIINELRKRLEKTTNDFINELEAKQKAENEANEAKNLRVERRKWFDDFAKNRAEIYAARIDDVWKYGNLIEGNGKDGKPALSLYYNNKAYPVKGAKRFTGIYDKEGTPIFTGDRLTYEKGCDKFTAVVVKKSGFYYLRVIKNNGSMVYALTHPEGSDLMMDDEDHKYMVVENSILYA